MNNRPMRSVVLIEPEIPENTGFVARLCHNFDFNLRLVNPDFNLEASRSTANNAQNILREAKIFDCFEEAVEGLDFVVGTKPSKGIECREFKFRENTSIVLGRESSGLTREELGKCDATVHIQASNYPSLNLSHAASILMYQASDYRGKNVEGERLDLIEDRGGEVLRELIGRASPEKGELDKVISELV